MSEEINNREYRQKVLQALISQLHAGKTVDEVKSQFAEAFEGVTAAEISQAEQALIAGGMEVSEVQRLCDVHAAVFKGSIEEIHQQTDQSEIPGHPANTLKLENRAIEQLIDGRLLPDCDLLPGSLPALMKDIGLLAQIDRHYAKKEYLLFPYMEQYGITAPPKVMWGVDDEIRAQLKEAAALGNKGDIEALKRETESLTRKIKEMIFKEENILLPMVLENLTQDQWKRIADESAETGYCLIENVPVWEPVRQATAANEQKAEPGRITMPTGEFTAQELTRMLDTLPIDITFVDKDGIVKYFSQSAERIFPRTKSVIGRNVVNCHPPASVHIVEKIIEDFKAGVKDHEDFWIQMGGKYVLIRYYAVRSENGEFLGVVEVTQDIKPIQEITGEKRLMNS